MKKSFVIGAIASLLAFSANTSQAGNKSLVVYYSQSSTTEKVAKIIQKKTGADIERVKLVEDYSGDMGAIAGAFMKERQENKFRDMQKMKANVADYDTLYVGYPVWAGTISGGMQSFLKSTEIKGKVIIPLCTFGSGGNTSITDLREA
ncbi:MAG: flavodoxin, partial [Prevotellaceae bacterium]|nr:flavodoxin [Prevotellaceae bacterium]